MLRQLNELTLQVEELKDQNGQLQYAMESTLEPVLMERVQDITDMRYGVDNGRERERKRERADGLCFCVCCCCCCLVMHWLM